MPRRKKTEESDLSFYRDALKDINKEVESVNEALETIEKAFANMSNRFDRFKRLVRKLEDQSGRGRKKGPSG